MSGSTGGAARRAAFLLAAAWCAGAGLAHGAGAAAAAAPDGGRLYQSHCAGCHGRDGQGNGLRKRGTDVPDFTSRAWHGGRTDAQLAATIRNGKGSAMPSFADRLSRQETQALVAHLRVLAPGAAPAPPAAESRDDFDDRYHQLESELEDLQRQFREASGRKRDP